MARNKVQCQKGWGRRARASSLLDDEVVAHLRDPAHAGGDRAGAVLGLGRVDEAAQLDDTLVSFDIDLSDVQVLVADKLATHLVADDRVVNVLAGAFACPRTGTGRHRPGEKTDENKGKNETCFCSW